MKKLFQFLMLVTAFALPGIVYALPIPSEVETRLNLGAVRGPGVQLGYQVISNKAQLLKCKYDYAVQGGTATSHNLKAVDGSDCLLPAKALVLNGIIDVITAPGSTGSATIAVGTGVAANDLKTATAKASFTGRMDVIPVHTAATAIKLSTVAKTPTMTIGTAALTSGKFNVYIEYLLGE